MLQHLSIHYLNYLNNHHPDLLLEWRQAGALHETIERQLDQAKPLLEKLSTAELHVDDILEQCLNELISVLPASRFDYITQLLSTEFEQQHEQLLSSGLLPYECMNLLQHCKPVFDNLNFSLANEDDSFIRYAMIAAISDYFERGQEQVSNAVQQSTTINA
ncbi:DUF1896 family protein [Lacibacter sp.]|uniref:DUF1896 family protein n=1 Tax=Lacibacter sp. TaxID=1915409 RepID=UPI002B4ACFB5|nr:DUF1896 family protein [Lacibacter sp.]HLP37005.1 DUF1896 family protein [Lacibacter sp.]